MADRCCGYVSHAHREFKNRHGYKSLVPGAEYNLHKVVNRVHLYHVGKMIYVPERFVHLQISAHGTLRYGWAINAVTRMNTHKKVTCKVTFLL